MLHYTKYAKKGVFSNPCFPFTDIYIYIYIYKRFEFLSIFAKDWIREKPVFWCILLKFLDYTQCSFPSSLEINLTYFFKFCSKYSGFLHSSKNREPSNILGAVLGIADAIEMWSYIRDVGSHVTVNLVTANSESVLNTSNSN